VCLGSVDDRLDWFQVRGFEGLASESFVDGSMEGVGCGGLGSVVDDDQAGPLKCVNVQRKEAHHEKEPRAAITPLLGTTSLGRKHVHDPKINGVGASLAPNVNGHIAFWLLGLGENVGKQTRLVPSLNMAHKVTERVIHET